MYFLTHILSPSLSHISVYYGVPLQLPVDEIPLLVASSPLAGFKPGSVCPGPRKSGEPSINVMIVALCFPLRCVKNSQWPPYLPPWHQFQHPLAPERLPQQSGELQSPALNCNLSDVIGNSIKITAAESFTQIIGLSVGQIEGWVGMVQGSCRVKIRGGSTGMYRLNPELWPQTDR